MFCFSKIYVCVHARVKLLRERHVLVYNFAMVLICFVFEIALSMEHVQNDTNFDARYGRYL